MDKIKVVLASLGLMFAVLFVPTLVFVAKGNDVGAAVTATLTVGIVVVATHTLAFAAGAWYTKGAMAMGAGIALKAQDTNDRWDERKSATMGKLFSEGARIGRMSAGGDAPPALPLPSQGMDWLPALSVFQASDLEEEGEW